MHVIAGFIPGSLAELQGLYGPFAFPELLLQKLWWRQEFACAGAQTADGRMLRVIAPGRWNRLGGPDFLDAVVELDGVRLRGAVEVHLRAEDWEAHHHRDDPAYDGVMLHVVLFPPPAPSTRGAGGRQIPVLALLPLLWYDLEEYAADEAVAALMNRADHRIAVELAPLPLKDLQTLLEPFGRQRWLAKVRYARRRVERLGWEAACHQTALEVLGYRSNRAAMLRVGTAHPLDEWREGEADVEAFYEEIRDAWSVQGVRPANQPRVRLRQYQAWVRERPQWPEQLLEWAVSAMIGWEAPELWTAGAQRRTCGFAGCWKHLLQQVTAATVARPRADHLVGDAFLPLLAAREEPLAGPAFTWWWMGYPGDLPNPIRCALRDLGLARGGAQPATHGAAQALLGWLVDRNLTIQSAAVAGSRQGA